MRIAITSSYDVNSYAVGIALQLIQEGYQPVVFILVQPSNWDTARSYARYRGWPETLIRFFRHFPTREPNFYLINYAKRQRWSKLSWSLTEIARQYGIKVLKIHNVNDAEVVGFIRNNVDIVINAGGGIFELGIINAPRLGIINAHMGSLPRFRGINTFRWSLFYGVPPEVTTYFIVRAIDQGDILLSQRVPITPRERTIDRLRHKSVPLQIKLIAKTIALLDKHRLKPRRQLARAGRQYYAMYPRLRAVVERNFRHLSN